MTKYFMLIFCCMLFLSANAAIPVHDAQPSQAENFISLQQGGKTATKKPSAIKKTVSSFLANVRPNKSESSIFNVLSFASSIMGYVMFFIPAALASTAALAGLSVFGTLFLLGGLVLGIVGLSRREKLSGLGIAGIALSILPVIGIAILLIAFAAAW